MNMQYACQALDWPHSKGALAYDIYEKGFVKIGSFWLKNSKFSPSPLYIDLRTPSNPSPGRLTESDVQNIAREIFKEVFAHNIEYDFVAGIPNAGEPFAQKFRDFLEYGERYKANLHKVGSGNVRRIEGFSVAFSNQEEHKDKRVLLIDDVISGGDSKLEAINEIEKAGYKITAIVVVVDREQGGSAKLEKLGYKIISVYRLSQLLAFYVLIARIFRNNFEEIMGYIDRSRKIINAA